MSDVPASFGTALAAARIRRGLTLDTVARTTRIPRHALEALEADDLGALPALVYARGFIRLYAQAVGLDPAVPLRLLEARQGERAQAEEVAHREAEERAHAERWADARLRVTYGVAIVCLIGVAMAALFSVSPPTPTEARHLPDAATPVEVQRLPEAAPAGLRPPLEAAPAVE